MTKMIKSDIEQKAKLIALARALGQEPDAQLVAEVEGYAAFQEELRENARLSIMQDLQQAIATAKQQLVETLVQEQPSEFPQPPSLQELEHFLSESTAEDEHDLDTETPQEISEPSAPAQTVTEQSLADLAASSISASFKRDSFQQPDPAAPTDLVSLQRKVKYLEQWLGKVSLAGPGGGASDTSNFTSYTRLVQDSAYTVARKDYYIGVNVHAPVTITLPDTAEAGRNLVIKDESGNCKHFPITLLGNIDNDANGLILKINNGAIQLIYRDGWRII